MKMLAHEMSYVYVVNHLSCRVYYGRIMICDYVDLSFYQDVRGGRVNILGGHSISHSKPKSVLFRTVSKIELFHCAVPKLLIRNRYYILFLILTCLILLDIACC
jgi:hypothetical protein